MSDSVEDPEILTMQNSRHPPREALAPESDKWRILQYGSVIPFPEGYADQPYFLRADDGALVMVCTVSSEGEGERGQHVVSIRSEDDGTTWSKPVGLESGLDVESSYAVVLKTPGGRIYAFYNHNTDDIRKVVADKEAYPDGWCRRVDSLGYFVFKYSDDHGKSWSADRWTVPVREFDIDRENTSGGKIRYFWNVGRAFWRGEQAYVPLHKVGGFGVDFFTRSEGALIRIPNLASEPDPDKLVFETLPEGEIGIRAPEGAGPIGEEHNFVVLSDGSLFTTYRTVSGYAACAYSRDGGLSWTTPDYLRYPNGKPVKNPRAANFIWKLSENRYLYWFHNHSGRSYADRNPVWCLAAREVAGPEGTQLEFSQPEILLYADDITIRMSYPDCMELASGDLLLTETEKRTCRIHRIPSAFVSTICGQWENPPVPSEKDILASWEGMPSGGQASLKVEFPTMHDREGGWDMISGKDLRAGFSLQVGIRDSWRAGVLLDNRTKNGRGLAVEVCEDNRLQIVLADGRSESSWKFAHRLVQGKSCKVVIVIDGGPKVVSAFFDGQFDDGGSEQQFGFGIFNPFLQSVNGRLELAVSESIEFLEIYNRALLAAEAVALTAAATADVQV